MKFIHTKRANNPHLKPRHHDFKSSIVLVSALIALLGISVAFGLAGQQTAVRHHASYHVIRTSQRTRASRPAEFPKMIQGLSEYALPLANPQLRPYYQNVIMLHITRRGICEQPLTVLKPGIKPRNAPKIARSRLGLDFMGINASADLTGVSHHRDQYRLELKLGYVEGSYLKTLHRAGLLKQSVISSQLVRKTRGIIKLRFDPQHQRFIFNHRPLKKIPKRTAINQLNQANIPNWWLNP